MISKLSNSQLSAATARCIERCNAGHHWPPDLAEFVAIVGETTPSILGFSAADVVDEYWRWRNGAWRYNSSEDFNWKSDVFYHICIEMRRQGVGRKLSEVELKNLAVRQLEKWAKKVEQGYSIPPVRRAETKGPPPPGYSQQADPDGRYRQRGDEMLARIRSSVKDKK
ncbi:MULTISPECIES: replication protein P [unclassified Serratia (in: enterobacteria)]|uniref:replication protein P n=1 Tax=unclassified Serratia (in: enterobacteria) TaxID=2647522 RepID=UPI000468C0C4|nr:MULTISPECIES: replication protein P [unclassified Serratia (in: enterobacteria)]